ncbi:MAG: hypothetical protein WBP64_12530 [Nitrososphaeraceae archaeon]
MRSPAYDTQLNIILVDIEGTTTPVDFVYKTLFPYASANIESFLRGHFREKEIMSLVEQLHKQYKNDKEEKLYVIGMTYLTATTGTILIAAASNHIIQYVS